jgi:transposase
MVVQIAWVVVKMRETYLSKFYYRLKAKRGAKKAIIAVARKLLVIIYHF